MSFLFLHLLLDWIFLILSLLPTLRNSPLHIVVTVLVHLFHHFHQITLRIFCLFCLRLTCADQTLFGLQISPVFGWVSLNERNGNSIGLYLVLTGTDVKLLLCWCHPEPQIFSIQVLNPQIKALVFKLADHLSFRETANTINSTGNVNLNLFVTLIPSKFRERFVHDIVNCF